MSDKPLSWWESLRNWIRYSLALLAVRHLGPAQLYWADPSKWEEYLRE